MKKKNKIKKPSAQYILMFSAFAWFAQVLEMNKENEPNPRLLRLYLNLAKNANINEEKRKLVMERIQEVLNKISTEKTVDYLLLSLCILGEYYDQLRGKKKHYQMMSHKDIVELQDEVLEGMPRDIWEPTMDFATEYVKEILKGDENER